jgi:hypothetical protein
MWSPDEIRLKKFFVERAHRLKSLEPLDGTFDLSAAVKRLSRFEHVYCVWDVVTIGTNGAFGTFQTQISDVGYASLR